MLKKKLKSIIGWCACIIGVLASCTAIISFILSEKRHAEKLLQDETRVECITNALGELIEIAKEASSNETSRIMALETSVTEVKSDLSVRQIWRANVHVSGTKNVISFVSSSTSTGVPKEIGGAKSHKTVPVPENCHLIIHVSGVKNRVFIDERIREHVTVGGVGAGCSVSWQSF